MDFVFKSQGVLMSKNRNIKLEVVKTESNFYKLA